MEARKHSFITDNKMDPKLKIHILRRRRKLLHRIAGVIINNKMELMKVLNDNGNSPEDLPYISMMECNLCHAHDVMHSRVIDVENDINKVINALHTEKPTQTQETTSTQHEAPVIKTGDAPIPATSDLESPK